MNETERKQIKPQLLKCAKENENKITFTGYVIVSSVCRAAVERIEELEQENAGLKEHHKSVCETLTNTHRSLREQLTKAKELLNEFMRISKASDEDFEHDYSELIGETEQFIKGLEK